jgi:hypothetical protein
MVRAASRPTTERETEEVSGGRTLQAVPVTSRARAGDHTHGWYGDADHDHADDDSRAFSVGPFVAVAADICGSATSCTADYGVLKLTLHAGSYAWQFVPIAGASFSDAGSTACS